MSLAGLRTDADAKESGAWFTYKGKLELRLRYTGTGNAAFQAAHREAMKSIRRKYRGGVEHVPDEVWRKKMIPIYARHVVADWKGARWTDDGPDLECTPENVEEVLSAPGLEWMLYQIIRDAENTDAYLTLEDDAKNSETPSVGS